MRKACVLTAIMLFCYKCNYAQFEYFGSRPLLKEQLRNAQHDTTKLRLNFNLSLNYVFSFPDTAMQYAQQGLKLAQGIKDRKWIAYTNFCIAQCMHVTNNFPRGIDLAL